MASFLSDSYREVTVDAPLYVVADSILKQLEGLKVALHVTISMPLLADVSKLTPVTCKSFRTSQLLTPHQPVISFKNSTSFTALQNKVMLVSFDHCYF